MTQCPSFLVFLFVICLCLGRELPRHHCPSLNSYPTFKAGRVSVAHPEEYHSRNGTSTLEYHLGEGGVGLYYSKAIEKGEEDAIVSALNVEVGVPPTVALAYFRSPEDVSPNLAVSDAPWQIDSISGKPVSVIAVSFLSLLEFLDVNQNGAFDADDEILQEVDLDQQMWGPMCTNTPEYSDTDRDSDSETGTPMLTYQRKHHRHARVDPSLQIFNVSTSRAGSTPESYVDFSIQVHNANVLGTLTREHKSRVFSPRSTHLDIKIRDFPFSRDDTLLALRIRMLGAEDLGSPDIPMEAPLPGAHPDEPLRRVKFRMPPPEPRPSKLADQEQPYAIWERQSTAISHKGKELSSAISMSKLRNSKAIFPTSLYGMFFSGLSKHAKLSSKHMVFVLSNDQPASLDWGVTLGFGCPVVADSGRLGTGRGGTRGSGHARSSLVVPLVLAMLLLAGCLTAYFLYSYRRKRFPVERRPIIESERM